MEKIKAWKREKAANRLASAAAAFLDAFGGDTPDWLRSEAVGLEEALLAYTETRNR